MPVPILATKLYIPKPRPDLVPRPRLIEQLNIGLDQRLIIISAPAGFGKSTLVSSWAQSPNLHQRIAWLSLEEDDSDLTRFLTYFIAALQTIEPNMGSIGCSPISWNCEHRSCSDNTAKRDDRTP